MSGFLTDVVVGNDLRSFKRYVLSFAESEDFREYHYEFSQALIRAAECGHDEIFRLCYEALEKYSISGLEESHVDLKSSSLANEKLRFFDHDLRECCKKAASNGHSQLLKQLLRKHDELVKNASQQAEEPWLLNVCFREALWKNQIECLDALLETYGKERIQDAIELLESTQETSSSKVREKTKALTKALSRSSFSLPGESSFTWLSKFSKDFAEKLFADVFRECVSQSLYSGFTFLSENSSFLTSPRKQQCFWILPEELSTSEFRSRKYEPEKLSRFFSLLEPNEKALKSLQEAVEAQILLSLSLESGDLKSDAFAANAEEINEELRLIYLASFSEEARKSSKFISRAVSLSAAEAKKELRISRSWKREHRARLIHTLLKSDSFRLTAPLDELNKFSESEFVSLAMFPGFYRELQRIKQPMDGLSNFQKFCISGEADEQTLRSVYSVSSGVNLKLREMIDNGLIRTFQELREVQSSSETKKSMRRL